MKKVVKAIAVPVKGIFGIVSEMWSLWKEASNWDEQTPKQKWYIIWFSLSFSLIFILAESWLIIPAIANFAWSARVVTKNVDIPDE